ncbi:MAG: DHHA1 domain-containing protein [Clostridia bacterium]|nr:DHHA1 domain-containing protein [Clostridia bacterium]
MTHRLYYSDSYLREFTATVENEIKTDKGYAITLDRTAFYPTSGGQPYDTGTLGEARVLDVYVEGDEVRHVVDKPLGMGKTVLGVIDWKRRFDHMQQHAGEHMIAGAIWQKLSGHTIGLHLGSEFSTIDVEMPDSTMRVGSEVIDEIEDIVNGWIQSDLPIKCWFPTDEEMKRAPLRKPPTVTEHIRLVQIGDVECVACGGTHPNSAGQVGLVKIIDVRPSRGKMRVAFLCGMRAFSDYRARFKSSNSAAEKLSTSPDGLPDAVDRALERIHEAERELKDERVKAAMDKIEQLIEQAAILDNGIAAVGRVLTGFDRDMLMSACKSLTARGIYALLANGEGEMANLIFAAPENSDIDMGKILSKAVAPFNGRGGGRGGMAQGMGRGLMCVNEGLKILGSI